MLISADSDIFDLDEFIEDIHLAVLIPVKAGAGEEFVDDEAGSEYGYGRGDGADWSGNSCGIGFLWRSINKSIICIYAISRIANIRHPGFINFSGCPLPFH